MSTTGERIRKARKDAGFTQAELAQACKVATITIQQYERDKRMPNQEMLRIIAEKLKINWLYLSNIDMPLRPTTLEDAKKMHTEYVRYTTIRDAIKSIISAMFGTVENDVCIEDFGIADMYTGGSIEYGRCSALFDEEAYWHIEDEIRYIIEKNCCLYDKETGRLMRIQHQPNSEYKEMQHNIQDLFSSIPTDKQQMVLDIIKIAVLNSAQTETPPEE